jgi:hypothetical protein
MDWDFEMSSVEARRGLDDRADEADEADMVTVCYGSVRIGWVGLVGIGAGAVVRSREVCWDRTVRHPEMCLDFIHRHVGLDDLYFHFFSLHESEDSTASAGSCIDSLHILRADADLEMSTSDGCGIRRRVAVPAK